MPMTLPGLAEIGLSDWPAWYRGLNPGFFVGETGARGGSNGVVSGSGKTSLKERRRKVLAGIGGPRGGAGCAKIEEYESKCCGSAGVGSGKKGNKGRLGEEMVGRLRGVYSFSI